MSTSTEWRAVGVDLPGPDTDPTRPTYEPGAWRADREEALNDLDYMRSYEPDTAYDETYLERRECVETITREEVH